MHHLHAALSAVVDLPGAHRDNDKSFALSPPERLADGTTRVEIRLLVDDRSFVDHFLERLGELAHRGVVLGGRPVPLLASGGPGSVGMVGLSSAVTWAELAREATPERNVRVTFLSPYFTRDGRTHHLFPLAGSVVRSLLRRWNVFAPGDVAGLRGEDVAVGIGGFKGETITVGAGSVRYTGFVGTVDYVFESRSDSDRRLAHQLFLVAPYTGLGSSTPYGFGLVELG